MPRRERGSIPDGLEFDARVIEELMLSVLEYVDLDDIDDDAVIRMQIVFAAALIYEEELDAAGLARYMGDVRMMAEEWVADALSAEGRNVSVVGGAASTTQKLARRVSSDT